MSTLQVMIITALLATIIGLGTTAWYQHSVTVSLRAELQTCSDQKASQSTEIVNWKNTCTQEKKALDLVVQQDQDREAAATVALKAAQKARDALNIKSSYILTQKVDPNDCVGAQQVLSTYLKAR